MARAMTAARRAALRKAQLASARKRKGRGRGRISPRTKRNLKRVAIGAAVVGAVAYGASRTNRGKANIAVSKNAARVAYSNHRTKRTKRVITKAQHAQRVSINRNAAQFRAYKKAHPDRFKHRQPFGKPR